MVNKEGVSMDFQSAARFGTRRVMVTDYDETAVKVNAKVVDEDTGEVICESGEGGDVISGDVIYKIREPKTDIDFNTPAKYNPKIEEVIIKNVDGEAHIQGFLNFERVIVDAPLSITNGCFSGFSTNPYNYETRYLYLSDKIVSMEDYAFSGSEINGNVVVDCSFSEDKFPTAMAKAVGLGIKVNYNIPEPRSQTN